MIKDKCRLGGWGEVQQENKMMSERDLEKKGKWVGIRGAKKRTKCSL